MPSPTVAGWTVFLAAIGMMAGLMAVDISKLPDWAAAQTPAFLGTVLAHFAVVTTAFVGGKLLPSAPRDSIPGGQRASDPPPKE